MVHAVIEHFPIAYNGILRDAHRLRFGIGSIRELVAVAGFDRYRFPFRRSTQLVRVPLLLNEIAGAFRKVA
jgi:hypothetical protein